jgi:acetyl-CoA C-acetyltransferase
MMDEFAVESFAGSPSAGQRALRRVNPSTAPTKILRPGRRRAPGFGSGKLAKLKPVFDRTYGNVTPGNSSQITDGAALLVIAAEEVVNEYGLTPLGASSTRTGERSGADGHGPVHASTPILKRNGLGLNDLDYWEINEAFAAQVLGCIAAWKDAAYCREQLGLDGPLGEIEDARLNVDGGAIALGHPVGSSGARVVLHALKVLERTVGNRDVASLCIGGGQGGAMLLERA